MRKRSRLFSEADSLVLGMLLLNLCSRIDVFVLSISTLAKSKTCLVSLLSSLLLLRQCSTPVIQYSTQYILPAGLLIDRGLKCMSEILLSVLCTRLRRL